MSPIAISKARFSTLLAVILSSVCAVLSGQVVDSRWSQPYRLSSAQGEASQAYSVAGRDDSIHVVWGEHGLPGDRSVIRYARFDGLLWHGPVDIYAKTGGFLHPLSQSPIGPLTLALDQTGYIHLAWSDGVLGPLYYTSVAVEDALSPERWRAPDRWNFPALTAVLQVDASGKLHLIWSGAIQGNPGVYYVGSEDAANSWTSPQQLDPDIPDDFWAPAVNFQLSESGTLHVQWHYQMSGLGQWIRYTRSLDDGATWAEPTTIDQLSSDPEELRLTHPRLQVLDSEVHVVWAGGGVINVGRRHRFSRDGGATWSPIQQLFADLHGSAGGDGFAFDKQGNLRFLAQIRWPMGLWEAIWDGLEWSDPSLIYSIARDHLEPIGDRITAHFVRLVVSEQGQLVSLFRNAQSQAQRILYAMHTHAALVFPHYGDGEGLSMQISLGNPGEATTGATLKVYDPNGVETEVVFEDGPASRLSFALPSGSRRTFSTAGTSQPVQSGFLALLSDGDQTSGVSIFQLKGSEASVLPSRTGTRFALFASRTAGQDTGIALLRLTSNPAHLKLYDSNGVLIGEQDWDFPERQAARFLSQLFELPETFEGMLVVESEGLLAGVGLRFGANLLSTIPLVKLDSPLEQSSISFPQIGDGGGLSMLFAFFNPSERESSVEACLFDSGGQPMRLPFDGGEKDCLATTLAPHATHVVRTSGDSDPPRAGFARVETEGDPVGALAVFRISPMEASVLSSYTGAKFSLFVERSEQLDTGIAIVRSSLDPVMLTLYDEAGNLLAAREYDFSGFHKAAFVSDLFTLPDSFRGTLMLESSTGLALVGLRFGRGVLSTIPANHLN